MLYPSEADDLMAEIKDWITDKWTWLYVATQDVWAFFIIALYFSKYSNMRLGKGFAIILELKYEFHSIDDSFESGL